MPKLCEVSQDWCLLALFGLKNGLSFQLLCEFTIESACRKRDAVNASMIYNRFNTSIK